MLTAPGFLVNLVRTPDYASEFLVPGESRKSSGDCGKTGGKTPLDATGRDDPEVPRVRGGSSLCAMGTFNRAKTIAPPHDSRDLGVGAPIPLTQIL